MSRWAALELAMAESDPTSLAAATRLRAQFSPEDAAWALTQVQLRREAATKFPNAHAMLFTRAGLEQATRPAVAAWRAQQLVEPGATVLDLGCGIGSDAMAFATAGAEVTAVDCDPETVQVASHNLSLVGAGPALEGRAEDTAVPPAAALFLDPARRTAAGRSWNVADFSPNWDFVLQALRREAPTVVKLGPGLPKQLIPPGVGATWVSHRGDVVECALTNTRPPGYQAVVIDRAGQVHVVDDSAAALPVRPVGRFIHEPDGALIRAGLISAIPDVWLVDEHLAYVSSDGPIASPLATSFEVVAQVPYDVAAMRAWLRQHQVGTVEIKVRGLDIDPAQLRKTLKPRGENRITLIAARVGGGAQAYLAHRRDSVR